MSTSSSIKETPLLKRICLASSFPEIFEGTNDRKEEARNIITAMHEIEDSQKYTEERQKNLEDIQKLLHDAAKKNPHAGQILKVLRGN